MARMAMFLARLGTGVSGGEPMPTRMSRHAALCPARWAVAFVLLAALSAMLAPRTADAHSGDATFPLPAHGLDGTDPNAGATAPETSRLAPSCPTGPGKHCGCGNALALIRAGQTLILDAGGVPSARFPPGPAERLTNQMAPPPPLLLSPASPRAPPLFS